ncbi:hypothetical protein N9L14_04145 [Alphaproteobacteria bacterium]|nr:hypothetical protein [Alphaproteobacteria bacterium]
MAKKQVSRLNVQRMLQNYSYSDKFELIELTDESQIRAVTSTLKKRLQHEPEAILLVL